MPMMWGYHFDGVGMVIGWVIMSLFWLGVLAVAVWALVRWLGSKPQSGAQQPPHGGPSALDLLNARYARGEIDTETYRSVRAELESSAAPNAERPKATATI